MVKYDRCDWEVNSFSLKQHYKTRLCTRIAKLSEVDINKKTFVIFEVDDFSSTDFFGSFFQVIRNRLSGCNSHKPMFFNWFFTFSGICQGRRYFLLYAQTQA